MSTLADRALAGAMTETQRILTIVTTVCLGLCAGVFFAFSTFVMPALRRLSATGGLAAMQSINKAAPTPLFMAVLFGPLVLCGALVVTALRRPGAATAWLCAAAACYLVGIVVTAAYHVPHNDALARVHADDTAAWRGYYPGWTAWNHVRTLAMTAATACAALALRPD
jgi:uncharacterized membrane protein